MAARGVEIHNGYVTIPAGMVSQLSMGTWAAPITQTSAGQILVGGVIQAIALGGDVHGGYFGVRAEVALTGDLRGVRARASVLSNAALTGFLYGLHTEVEVGGATSSISGRTVGHTIEIYSETGCVHTGDVHGIFVNNYIDGTVTVYQMVRLENNGSAVPQSIIAVYVNDASYFLHFTPNTPAAGGWVATGDRTAGSATNAAGWLKVDMPAGDKYIQLFD